MYGTLRVTASMGATYDPHGCSTLNGLLAACGPRSDRMCADRRVSRRVMKVLRRGGDVS
jgi:hypothetical protein